MSKPQRTRVVPSTADATGDDMVKNVPGNFYDKHGSRNPLVRFIMKRFHRAVLDALLELPHSMLLDVGCGEGRTTAVFVDALESQVVGVELELEVINEARVHAPGAALAAASVYQLPFGDSVFDVVTGTEVLEHLDSTGSALEELRRVARHAVVITVPHEPWFRIANMARGKYLGDLGNTPGHVQNWTKHGLTRFLSSVGATADVRTTGLWCLAIVKP
jgi:ubiquinone/menaquinone biosynthesis C-methylase UbiE